MAQSKGNMKNGDRDSEVFFFFFFFFGSLLLSAFLAKAVSKYLLQ
jgi:hypothetical protein